MQSIHNDDLVSIIMPAFNAAKFIEASVNSVKEQTYREWELLVVDDRSSDDTVSVVQAMADVEQRVRVIRLTKNSGPGEARARAIHEARGRYIAFLDSDDMWLPLKLEKQVAFVRSRKAVISFTQFRRFDDETGRIGRVINVPDSLGYYGLLGNTAIAPSSAMIDRGILEEWDPPVMPKIYIEDYPLFYQILKQGHYAYGLHEDLLRYRYRQNSFSRNKGSYAKKIWRTYRDVEQLNFFVAGFFFANYAFRGLIKYSRF